jgi:hypothetical protein
MAKEIYYPPTHAEGQYHCPHCGVYAKQLWASLEAENRTFCGSISHLDRFRDSLPEEWTVSRCEHCGGLALWLEKQMIYPKKIPVSQPNSDLSPEIQADYLEAANVLGDSPRSAAAIIRLALQKLCKQLGEKGENINDDIASMVKKGLNPMIQKSLDTLRITGNNAVHPGELDLTDDAERVAKLFGLINFIAEKMITEPKEIESIYGDLPPDSKKAVEKRDGPTK